MIKKNSFAMWNDKLVWVCERNADRAFVQIANPTDEERVFNPPEGEKISVALSELKPL